MLKFPYIYNAHRHGLNFLISGLKHKKIAKKRKLGRNPRIPFTQQQIDCLEKKYSDSRYLSSLDVVGLSKDLDLSEARVIIFSISLFSLFVWKIFKRQFQLYSHILDKLVFGILKINPQHVVCCI